MKNLFVSYEIAKLLKEKGFNEPCFRHYIKGISSDMFNAKENKFSDELSTIKNSDGENIAAPLYQQIVDWFRDKQGIVIELTAYEVGWMTTLSKYPKIEKYIFQKVEIESYYEALNKGIEEALKLI